jgi:hypothetical protein
MKSEVEESSAGIRSYQILTVIGSLFTIWDLTSANKMSVDVLAEYLCYNIRISL